MRSVYRLSNFVARRQTRGNYPEITLFVSMVLNGNKQGKAQFATHTAWFSAVRLIELQTRGDVTSSRRSSDGFFCVGTGSFSHRALDGALASPRSHFPLPRDSSRKTSQTSQLNARRAKNVREQISQGYPAAIQSIFTFLYQFFFIFFFRHLTKFATGTQKKKKNSPPCAHHKISAARRSLREETTARLQPYRSPHVPDKGC